MCEEESVEEYCESCKDDIKLMQTYSDELEKQHQIDKTFLESINYLFNKRLKDFFDGEIAELPGHNFRISKEWKGKNQNAAYCIDLYVDQWRDGGHSGDDYGGTCYLRLADNSYLTWDYEC